MTEQVRQFCLSHRSQELAGFYDQVEQALKRGKSYLSVEQARNVIFSKKAEKASLQWILGSGLDGKLVKTGGNVLIHRIALVGGYEWVLISEGGRESVHLVHRDFFMNDQESYPGQWIKISHPFLAGGDWARYPFTVFQTGPDAAARMNESIHCSNALVFQDADLRFAQHIYAPLMPVFIGFDPKVGDPQSEELKRLFRIPSLAEFVKGCVQADGFSAIMKANLSFEHDEIEDNLRAAELRCIQWLVQAYMDIASIESTPAAAFSALSYMWTGFQMGAFEDYCWIGDRAPLADVLRNAAYTALWSFARATNRLWMEDWDGRGAAPKFRLSGWKSYLGLYSLMTEAKTNGLGRIEYFLFLDGSESVMHAKQCDCLVEFVGISDKAPHSALFDVVADSRPLGYFTEGDFDLSEIVQSATLQGVSYGIRTGSFLALEELLGIHTDLLDAITESELQFSSVPVV